MQLILKDILIVILGGLFGWCLGQLPKRVVIGVLAAAIIIFILVVSKVSLN